MSRHPDHEPAEIPVVQLFLDDEKLNQIRRRCAEGYGTFQEAGEYASDIDPEWFPDVHSIALSAEPSRPKLESSHHLDITVHPDGQVQDITQFMSDKLFTNSYNIQYGDNGELEHYSVGTDFAFSTPDQIPDGLRLKGANRVYGFIYQTERDVEAHLGIFLNEVKLYWTLRIVNGKLETERNFIGTDSRLNYNFDVLPWHPIEGYEELLQKVKPIFDEMDIHLELGYQQVIFRTKYQDHQTTFTLGTPSQRTLEGAISRLLTKQEEATPIPLIVPLKIVERK